MNKNIKALDIAEMQIGQRLNETDAKHYKPVHGGYPEGPSNPIPGSEWTATDDVAEMEEVVEETIAAEIVASDSPRKNGFNYGVGWGQQNPKPPIYFDAVRLSEALEQIAHDTSRRSWRIITAIRAVRLAETDTEKRLAVRHLTDEVSEILSGQDGEQIKLHMLVNDLAHQINIVAPPNPKGYVPTMGIQYALKPIRDTIYKIRAYFAATAG